MTILKQYRAIKSTVLLLISCALLVGCAVAPPSGPSVMALPGSGKNFDQFRYDDADCRNFAMAQIGGAAANQAANDTAANNAVAGTLLGAVAGAAIGGREGAGAGAGIGLLMGSASGAEDSRYAARGGQKRYDNAYVQCMYAKGQRVPVPANYNQRAPVAPMQYSNEVTPQQNYSQQNYGQQGYQASPAYPPGAPQSAPRRAPAVPPHDAGMPPDYAAQNPPITYIAPGQCMDCGIVESIRESVAQPRETGGGGALVGGLIGGVIGNQVGKGNGRALATIAGALAGGAIGNREEENRTPHNIGSFQIVVRMTDGSLVFVNQVRPPAWQLGDRVRVVNGELYPR
jgi:outer membrane lipoprotein SlyB